MLTITRLTAQGTNRDGANILAYLKATEYYRDKDGNVQSASQWVGNGA